MTIGLVEFHLDRLELYRWVAWTKSIGQHRRKLVKEMGGQGFAGGGLLGCEGEAIVVVEVAICQRGDAGLKRRSNLDHVEDHAVLRLTLNHGLETPAVVVGRFPNRKRVGGDEFEVEDQLAPHGSFSGWGAAVWGGGRSDRPNA